MAVQCPAIEWPSFLDVCGPEEDPTIALKGTARIGTTPLQIVGVRIDPRLRRTPDYKPNVPESAYQTAVLETVLEELEYLSEELAEVITSSERSIVELPTGPYVFLVLPVR